MKLKLLKWFYKYFQIYDMSKKNYQWGITFWYTNKVDWGLFVTLKSKRIAFCSEKWRR